MKKLFIKSTAVFFVIISVTVSGCKFSKTVDENANYNKEMTYATLFNYYSAEYEALALQAYNIASERIREVRKENPGSNSLAVVLDLDETVLDNSPYQAKLIVENISYDSLWNKWCKLEVARAIPGSLSFVQLADSLGFKVFYLSNRKEKYVKKSTMENLRKLGFPQVNDENMLLRTSSNNKEPRRQNIMQNYQISLLIGDNLGDFFVDAESPDGRDSQVADYAGQFGNKFIVLPNAMYGNWIQSLDITNNPQEVDLLLDSMAFEY